jgi:peptide-methionine (S)-S-oxide reductase
MKYGTVPVITEIMAARRWFPAEKYHQKYLEKGGQSALKGDTSQIRYYG